MSITSEPESLNNNSKPPLLALLLTVIVAILVSTPMILKLSSSAYDYIVHADLATRMQADKTVLTPHFLLQACIIVVQRIVPLSANTAEAVVVIIAITSTAALLFRLLQQTCSSWLAGGVTVGLLLAVPLPLLAPLDHHLYLGYIGITVYHNPTILLLKPFAILMFGALCTRQESIGVPEIIVTALATTACALAKPSYIIVILPALLISAVSPHIRHQLTRRSILVIAGIIFPALCVLAGQYLYTYSSSQLPGVYAGKSQIIFAPLAVMAHMSAWLPGKLLLSLAFPLTVASCYFRDLCHNFRLQFAWICFAIGAGYTYLLAESGPRMMQGNFGWSGQITLFILFAVSAEFVSNQFTAKLGAEPAQKNKLFLCAAVFMLHVISGVVFYAAEYSASERFW